MNFETTTCISSDHIILLKHYAKKLDVSVSKLISYLIQYAAKKEKRKTQVFKNISYRDRDMDNKWIRFHLCISWSEYEFLLDIKKIWKVSIAKAIEICVDTVLDEFFNYVIRRRKESVTDNYLSYYENRSYTFDFFKVKGIHCCQFCWGPPPEILKS